jgi:hypothetical protein
MFKDRAEADAFASKFRTVLNKYGLDARVGCSHYPDRNNYLRLRYVKCSEKFKASVTGKVSVLTRLECLIHKLLTKKLDDIEMYTPIEASANVICTRSKHKISLDKDGNLRLHNHPYESIRYDRLMYMLGDTKCPRCLRLLDAWRRGTLYDKSGAVSLPPSFRVAYSRAKTKADCRKSIKSYQLAHKDPYVDMTMDARVLEKIKPLFYNILHITRYAGDLSDSNYSSYPRLAVPAYLDYVKPIQKPLLYITVTVAYQPTCLPIEFTKVLDLMSEQSKVKVTLTDYTQYRNKHACALVIYIKDIIKWYANIGSKGLNVIDGFFVTELIRSISNDEKEVMIIDYRDHKQMFPDFVLRPFRIKRLVGNTWQLVEQLTQSQDENLK